MGAANLWWVPLANIFGRRPIILGNILLLVLSCMWAGLAKSFGSLLAARVVMGIAVAPADTSKKLPLVLVNFRNLLINTVYSSCPKCDRRNIFHSPAWSSHGKSNLLGLEIQNLLMILKGCYTVCICLGPIIGGMSGGYIAGTKGLAWIHWVNVMLSAILLLACATLVPETLFNRAKALPSSQNQDLMSSEGKPDAEIVENVTSTSSDDSLNQQTLYDSMLKLRKYEGDFIKTFLAPWKTLRLPGVWLVMFWYAGLVGGVVTITTVGPSLIAAPPYLWGNNSGLIMTGGIVGAILGLIVTNLSADRVIINRSKLQGNSFVEPEARLPIAIPGLFLATTGLWTFGFCAQNLGPAHMWVGMQVGLGMLCFGLMQAPSIGFNYVSIFNP